MRRFLLLSVWLSLQKFLLLQPPKTPKHKTAQRCRDQAPLLEQLCPAVIASNPLKFPSLYFQRL